MHRFPALDEFDRQQKIWIGGGFFRAVEHARRSHEIDNRYGVGRVVGQVLARDPVDRRVEMRAGVLAAREIVPIPACVSWCSKFAPNVGTLPLGQKPSVAPNRLSRSFNCPNDEAARHIINIIV